jgi:hypothetical protein
MPNRLLRILPYIDTVSISIDGLGEVNKWTRGVDGNQILSCIKECVNQIKRQNLGTHIRTIAVITNQNYLHFAALAKEIHNISPDIRVHATFMKPYTHPLSLISHTANYKAFIENVQKLNGDYHGIKLEGPPLNEGQHREVVCYRQFFKAWVMEEGDFVTCKPPAYIKHYYHELIEAIPNRNYSGSVSALKRMIDTCLIHRYDPICPFPCDCGEYMENILLACSVYELPEEYRYWATRMRKDENKAACDFIRKYINPEFNLELLNSYGLEEPASISLPPVSSAGASMSRGRRS